MSILSLRKSGGNAWGKNRDKQASLIDSELLAGVFAKHNTDDCIHVLDVGLGVADTVEVLQQFRCKVYFLDLLGVIEKDSIDGIAAVFAEYSGELFDVCLFWDLLHRLSPAQLSQLSNELEPYIYSRTQAHTLVNPAASESYRLRGVNQLAVTPGAGHEYPTRSLTRLLQHFQCFEILTDEFRTDGRLEMVLQTPQKR